MTTDLENTTQAIQMTNTMEMDLHGVKEQVNLIQHIMKGVMKRDVHYGTIPGCGPKPTLLKPGAEKIGMTFKLAPKYQVIEKQMGGDHREYRVTCELIHRITGHFLGEGLGICSTMEGKFRYRNVSKVCPSCGAEAIIKGKAEYGGGWVCFKKKEGCGAKFIDGDSSIEDQDSGKIEHDNPADYYNTVLKMAKKRAHVDAILTATAASDIFTQDIEDMPEVIHGAATVEKKAPIDDPKPLELITDKQRTRLNTLATNNKWEISAVKSLLANHGFDSSKLVTKDKYKEICETLEGGMSGVTVDESTGEIIPQWVMDGLKEDPNK